MKEQDRRRVVNFQKILDNDDPFVHGFSFEVGRQLLAIIERLDNQLTEIKEAGKPIICFVRHVSKKDDDHIIAAYAMGHKGDWQELNLGQLRRLAKALKEVKDE